MSSAEYIVIKRGADWSFTINGELYGPFQNKLAAERAAIFEAKHRGKKGETARVSVDEPNDGVPVIFDTED